MRDLYTRTPRAPARSAGAAHMSSSRLRAATSVAPAALVSALLALLAGCQPEVGDPCRRTIDCGLQGTLSCDVSNAPNDPGNQGECTLENCSFGVCPNEAVCIKVYASEFASVVCDPVEEDRSTDDCLPHEVCLPEGLCGDELRAQTSCRRECKSDADCRDNYSCENTGRNGVYVAPDPDDPDNVVTTRICVPKP